MNQSDFFLNLSDHSKNEGFSLLVQGQEFEDAKRQSAGMQAVMGAMAAVGFGLIGSMSTGYMDKTDKDGLIADLKRMREHCDLVGVNLSGGGVNLRLGINADDVSVEALVGRFALIHERAFDFRKYASSFMRSVVSDGKLPTFVQVVVAFSTHQRARDFIQNHAEKCKHAATWKKVHTQPWVVDLEDEDITRFRHALTNLVAKMIPSETEKLKAGLFRVRPK